MVIQEAETTNGNHMLVVHVKHVPSNRTVTLFSVVHRSTAPYRAKIQPRDNELPDILKKSYYQPDLVARMAPGIGTLTGQKVTNKWVCDTPSEFRSTLRDVFNLGILKSEVLSLVSGTTSSSNTGDEAEERNEDASDGEATYTG